MEAAEQTLAPEQRAQYKPPKLVELGSVYDLTQAHCIDEHGSPLPHPFCTSA